VADRVQVLGLEMSVALIGGVAVLPTIRPASQWADAFCEWI
jgi:hypothetical protein